MYQRGNRFDFDFLRLEVELIWTVSVTVTSVRAVLLSMSRVCVDL